MPSRRLWRKRSPTVSAPVTSRQAKPGRAKLVRRRWGDSDHRTSVKLETPNFKIQLSRRLGFAGLALLLGGCGLQKPTGSLAIRTPGSWAAASSGNEGRISTGWLSSFSDAGLTRSVNEALKHNRSLKSAAARLREAREQPIIARAGQLPSVDVGGRGSLTDSSSISLTESYGLNLAASWEPDLWGRLRDLTPALPMPMSGRPSRIFAGHACRSQQMPQRLTRISFPPGSRSPMRSSPWNRSRKTSVSSSATTRPPVKGRSTSSSPAPTCLPPSVPSKFGGSPGKTWRARWRCCKANIRAEGHARKRELPSLPGSVPSGIPAGLIERRPDLAAARADIFASAKRADAARKRLLPDFSLTGSSGAAGARLSDLTSLDFLVSSISARVDQVVFDGGALKAQARGALARNDRFVNEYARSSLSRRSARSRQRSPQTARWPCRRSS